MDVVGKIEATIAMQDAVWSAVAKRLQPDRLDAIARSYAAIVSISKDDAAAMVALEANSPGATDFQKIIRKFEGPSDVPATIRKESKPVSPYQDEDWSNINPDPELIGEEDQKMRHATNAEMLKLCQRGVGEEVQKIRAENPRLSESQARSRVFAENPGLRQSMVKLARGPENEFAKRSSRAEIDVAEKTAEIQKAHPELTEAQAYTRAIETTPGLMKRLLRGEA